MRTYKKNVNGEEALLPFVSSLNASHPTPAHDRSVFVCPLGMRENKAALNMQNLGFCKPKTFSSLPLRELP